MSSRLFFLFDNSAKRVNLLTMKGHIKINILIFIIVFSLIIPYNNFFIYCKALQSGGITIDAKQDKVKVYVNNKLYGVAIGPSTITDLKPGTYLIEIRKDNFNPWKKYVTLTEGKGIVLKIDLVPLNNRKKSSQNLFLPKKNIPNPTHWKRIKYIEVGWNSLSYSIYLGVVTAILWYVTEKEKLSEYSSQQDINMLRGSTIGFGVVSITAVGIGVYYIAKSNGTYYYDLSNRYSTRNEKIAMIEMSIKI